jgi:hypothetical protein|tara:strand:- start:470 stop:685 length:216 start_codon:yes stop_codon:yes gene_type:complete
MLNDLMGLTDNDYIYNQSRAHSADMLFFKIRAWFWGSCATLSAFFIGNIMGVFDINILGWILDTFWHSWEI